MVYEALPRFYPDGIHAKCSLFAIDCEYIEKLRYGLDEGARSYRCVSAAYHEELEILSLISGSLEVVIDGNSVILSPGECAVILPYREHSGYCPTDGETTKYYCVKIEVGRFLNGTGSLADELRAISECRFSCPEKIGGEKGSALSRLAEELYGVSDGADRLSPVKQAEKMAVVWKILAVIVGGASAGQRTPHRRAEHRLHPPCLLNCRGELPDRADQPGRRRADELHADLFLPGFPEMLREELLGVPHRVPRFHGDLYARAVRDNRRDRGEGRVRRLLLFLECFQAAGGGFAAGIFPREWIKKRPPFPAAPLAVLSCPRASPTFFRCSSRPWISDSLSSTRRRSCP